MRKELELKTLPPEAPNYCPHCSGLLVYKAKVSTFFLYADGVAWARTREEDVYIVECSGCDYYRCGETPAALIRTIHEDENSRVKAD